MKTWVKSLWSIVLLGAAASSAMAGEPPCEASGAGRCYYISPIRGNDAHDGSYARPWKSVRPIVSYYDARLRPPTWVSLGPGDVVYFLEGTHSETVPYNPQDPHDGRLMMLRGVRGTPEAPILFRAFPGHRVEFSPTARIPGIYFLQCDHIVVDGLEIHGTYGPGLQVFEGRGIEIRNLWVHHCDGVDNDNIAGVYLQDLLDVELHHCVLNDNYDRTCADTGGVKTENSRNLVSFGGGRMRFHHNFIYQSQPISAVRTGTGIGFKHALRVESELEIDHNVFSNCWSSAIGLGYTAANAAAYTARVHQNLIMDSDGIRVDDLGATPAAGIRAFIQDNTYVERTGTATVRALGFDPTPEAVVRVDFSRNIVVDHGVHSMDAGVLTVHAYGEDALYDQVMTEGSLTCRSNVYYSPRAPARWSFFSRNGGVHGSQGTLADLAEWQALGFDLDSLETDPQLDAAFVPANSATQSAGWRPEVDVPRLILHANGPKLRIATGAHPLIRIEYADSLVPAVHWKERARLLGNRGDVEYQDTEQPWASARYYRVKAGW